MHAQKLLLHVKQASEANDTDPPVSPNAVPYNQNCTLHISSLILHVFAQAQTRH